jgi:RND family efflux transporter MFP subunit
MYKTTIWVAGALFLLASCNRSASGEEGHHHHHSDEAEAHSHEHHHHDGDEDEDDPAAHHEHSDASGADGIVFTAEQAAKTGIEFFTVQPGDFHEVITASGEILPARGDEASVAATVSGMVAFGAAKPAEGKSVNKGETLFHISSKNVAEGDYIVRARAAYDQARTAYARAETLVKEQIISQKEFEQRKYDYETARTAYEALNNATERGMAVVSPLSGYVKNIFVREGDYVNVGDVVAVVSQNRRLVLQAEVSQRHYAALQTIATANFETLYNNKLYSLKELNGKQLSFGKSAANGSFYIPVNFEFDNPGDVIPGSYVSVYLLSSPLKNVLFVPVSSLTEEQGAHFVYVKTGGEHYEKREVVVGGNDGQNVQIRSGLESGETVVSKGAYQLRLASVSGVIPEGHSH